jgi:hypothetical protein
MRATGWEGLVLSKRATLRMEVQDKVVYVHEPMIAKGFRLISQRLQALPSTVTIFESFYR